MRRLLGRLVSVRVKATDEVNCGRGSGAQLGIGLWGMSYGRLGTEKEESEGVRPQYNTWGGGALQLDLWGAERDSQELSQNGPKPKQIESLGGGPSFKGAGLEPLKGARPGGWGWRVVGGQGWAPAFLGRVEPWGAPLRGRT